MRRTNGRMRCRRIARRAEYVAILSNPIDQLRMCSARDVAELALIKRKLTT